MPERRTTPMILHLDRQVVAVDKPAGLLSQPDRSHDPCVIDLLRELLVAALPPKADRGPATPFLASVHRMDRPVSGVLMVARTSKAAARLATQFRNHEVVKRYLAVASGTPSFDHSRAVVWLRKVKEENRVEFRP